MKNLFVLSPKNHVIGRSSVVLCIMRDAAREPIFVNIYIVYRISLIYSIKKLEYSHMRSNCEVEGKNSINYWILQAPQQCCGAVHSLVVEPLLSAVAEPQPDIAGKPRDGRWPDSHPHSSERLGGTSSTLSLPVELQRTTPTTQVMA
jgi:hypothetical protein